jgi:hypothetical protein
MTTKSHPNPNFLYVPVPTSLADLLEQAAAEGLEPARNMDFIHERERSIKFGAGKYVETKNSVEVSYGIMGAILHCLGYSDSQLLDEVDEDNFLAILKQRGIQVDEDVINVLCYWFSNVHPDFAEMAKLIRERGGDVPLPKHRKEYPLSRARING